MKQCHFLTIEDQFNFGKYCQVSLADVMEINPSYLDWCIKHCTGVDIILHDSAQEQIRILYPNFIMDYLFEAMRIDKCCEEHAACSDSGCLDDIDDNDDFDHNIMI